MANRRTVATALAILGAFAAGAYRLGERNRPMRRLAAAVGVWRPVEPRFTGGFAYASCRPAGRERKPSPGLCRDDATAGTAVEARVRRFLGDLGRRPQTAETLHARGVGDLFLDPDSRAFQAAAQELERAALLAPGDAAVANDLGAAYLILAEREGQPWLLVKALSAFEEARAFMPESPEALFNRALALERLELHGQARSAWQTFLAVDAGSGWAEEADEHLSRLQKPSADLLWRGQFGPLAAAASRNDRKAIAAIVGAFPEEARDYASRDLLARWGELAREHQGAEAAQILAEARQIGGSLAEITGDSTAADAARAIERVGDEGLRAALARAQVEYREGEETFAAGDDGSAAGHLDAAIGPLKRAGSPLAAWADATRAAITFQAGREKEAIDRLGAIRHRMGARYPALDGRLAWYLGLCEVKQGRPGTGLPFYREARAGFAALGERENLGAVQALIAEALSLLGDQEAAWAERLAGSANLGAFPRSRRLHNLLREAADAALQGGEARAALAIQNEDLAVAGRAKGRSWRAEALLWRSRIQLALGRSAEAFADLAAARAETARLAAGATAEKLAADSLLVEGELESRRGRPLAAIADFTRAIQAYQHKQAALDLAVALIGRAEAELRRGRDGDAERDQEAAIDLFERQRTAVADRELLAASAAATQGTFDRMIEMEVERRGQRERALEFAERSRSLDANPRATTIAALGQRLAAIPENAAVIEYALLPDRLYIWVLTHQGLRFAARDVDSRRLAGEVALLLESLRPGILRLDRGSVAADLFEEVVAPAVRALPPRTPLILVPDKVLFTLPFAALVDRETGRYLVEDHPLAVVPSLRYGLDRWSNPRPEIGSWHATLVGNPAFDHAAFPSFEDLPGGDREVEEIAGFYPGADVLEGRSAAPRAILAGLAACELFHFAGHAVANPRHPGLSYLLAAPEPESPAGAVYARDIAGRHFPRLRLVVLSACGSLHPAASRATGIAGLAQPLLEAGASAVVGSLWSVEDRTTSRLMPAFHSAFAKEWDAARALQAAQLSLLHGPYPDLRSPAAWAPFQVFGLLEPHTR